MASISSSELFPELKTALDAHIREASEAAIKRALAEVEKEIRNRVGIIALQLVSHYDVMRRGNDLLITVHLNKEEKL